MTMMINIEIKYDLKKIQEEKGFDPLGLDESESERKKKMLFLHHGE